ncbi:MAG: ABC transporter permease [Anaerolineales bacterium]
MSQLFRIYRALLRANWMTVLEYRAQAILWVISLLFPLVMMNVWLAVVAEAGPLVGWGSSEFLSYYLGAVLVNHFTVCWLLWDWDEDIRTGGLSAKLLKPLDPVHHWLTNEMGWKAFIAIIFTPILIALAWLSPEVNYPATPPQLLLFVVSVVTGYALNFVMNTALAMLAFWSTQSSNAAQLIFGVGQFLSGWIAPLALFPESIRAVAYLTPFPYTLGFPLELLMGRLTGPEIGMNFAVSLVWAVIFFGLYRFFWRQGLKRYEAVGA